MLVQQEWILTPRRLALHVPTKTAVVADLHLGYAQARRRSGDAVPLVDIEDALAPIASAALDYQFHRLVIAGDLFESGFCQDLWHALHKSLAQLDVQVIAVIPGNHDRGLAGQVNVPLADSFDLGSWTVIHGHEKTPPPRAVMGHWHPCISLRGNKVPCYLVGPRRLILPAFSADAAGVDVSGRIAWQSYACHAIVGDRVLDPCRLPRQSRSLGGRQRSNRPWGGRLQKGS